MKTLLIIEKAPESGFNTKILEQITNNSSEKNSITIYIHHEGVRWLQSEHWYRIYDLNQNSLYYVNADDAYKYKVPFQQGVIFSNPKIFFQLVRWADRIHFLS